MDIRVLTLGDSAFTIEFPALKGALGARRVRALRARVQDETDVGALVGILDVISASRSLTVCLDPYIADYELVRARVAALAQESASEVERAGPIWTLPACYSGEYAPDLDDVAQRSGLKSQEVVDLHSSLIYDVFLIGFLPGFAFLGEIDERLRFPRRISPRVRVPAGSVGIANEQTAVYPWESPGGWHLLARCPVPFFNSAWSQPSLLSPGGRVRFDPISISEYEKLQGELNSGQLNPQSFLMEKGGI
ncbi:5-oxoprolinase subunit PxpB [Kiloniella antarctica]|uniref:5-oxoprolinase subunit PxpB n=1 Tax=Kiloniella antarctica TaxID=1550907 RepID=A0ABW5BM40_9PROT